MKKLVTPEVYNKAVEAAKEMAICKGNFDIFCNIYMARTDSKEINSNTKTVLQRTFESLQWYTALFPLNEITLHDPNLPAPQTVDLQRILQAVESTKLFLNVVYKYPDGDIDYNELSDHIDSLQAVADYIISLSK